MQSRGAVTAVRAAAMGLVATGLIEVLARVAPRVDPLYIYLGAVALVVLIDGVLPGALAAVAVTEIYSLLYAPKSRSLFENTMWALALSAGTLLVAAAIRGLVRSRRRRPPEIFTPMPVMLSTSLVEEPPVQSNAEILAALDELRAEVRAAVATPREGRGEEVEKLEKLEHMLAEAHSGEAEQRSRAATATRERDDERTRAESLAAELTLLRMELHQGREESAALNTEAEQLRADLAASRDETSTLLARITELELSMREAERTRTDLAAAREENASLAERIAELETHATEAEQLRVDLAAVRNENGTLVARMAELESSAGASRHLHTDLATAREENAFLVARNAEIETAVREAAQLREDNAALTARVAELESERANLEQEFDAKLQTIVGHLASDHENDLGQALADKEEARAEARLLSARLSTLQKKYEEDHELATRILTETRASAQREIDALRAKVAAKLAAPPPPLPPREGPPRARILVAHPDAELRRNAQASLQAAGYAVMTAADGLEALRLASATHPDVVIADAVMPKMNGRELCQLLKSQEKTANIRVVLLLRNVDEPPKGELLPDDILRKPVPLETLRTTLASLLANQRA